MRSRILPVRYVVFALGTNGPVTDDAEIDSLMEVVGPDRISVLVATRSPRQWVQSTNDALKRAAERYENVRVINWYAYSEEGTDLSTATARISRAPGPRSTSRS